MIHVVAVITAQPDQRAALLELFNANVPAVLAEAGCIEYGAAVDVDAIGKAQARFGDDSFVVIEKWESIEHLRAHAVAPHMQEYAAKAKPLIANRAIHVLGPA